MGILDQATLDLPCPGCGAKTTKKWSWFKDDPESFDCSGCGRTVVLDYTEGSELGEALRSVEESVEDFQKTIRDLNRKMR